jgi:hypothetical protein
MTTSSRTLQAAFALILLFGATLALAASSQIYRTVDENGNVVFTDIPPREGETGEQIVVETPNLVIAEEALGPREGWVVEPEDEAEEQKFSYRSLMVKSPVNDAPIRENAGNITIISSANPTLRQGHTMRLMLDDQLVKEGSRAQFSLTNVDRGTHWVVMEIYDADGALLIRSEPSSFHMLRFAGGNPRPGPS